MKNLHLQVDSKIYNIWVGSEMKKENLGQIMSENNFENKNVKKICRNKMLENRLQEGFMKIQNASNHPTGWFEFFRFRDVEA